MGVIPKEAAKTIWEKARRGLRRGQDRPPSSAVKHDVIAFTHLAEFIGPD